MVLGVEAIVHVDAPPPHHPFQARGAGSHLMPLLISLRAIEGNSEVIVASTML